MPGKVERIPFNGYRLFYAERKQATGAHYTNINYAWSQLSKSQKSKYTERASKMKQLADTRPKSSSSHPQQFQPKVSNDGPNVQPMAPGENRHKSLRGRVGRRNGYHRFCIEKHLTGISRKHINAQWRELSDDEKRIYKDRAAKMNITKQDVQRVSCTEPVPHLVPLSNLKLQLEEVIGVCDHIKGESYAEWWKDFDDVANRAALISASRPAHQQLAPSSMPDWMLTTDAAGNWSATLNIHPGSEHSAFRRSMAVP